MNGAGNLVIMDNLSLGVEDECFYVNECNAQAVRRHIKEDKDFLKATECASCKRETLEL